jgi:hypothetical protein
MLTYTDVCCNPVRRYPSLQVSGMKITVPSGTYDLDGGLALLQEDEEHTVVSGVVPLDISGYLVREVVSGEIRLFVDEIEPGEHGYSFEGNSFQVLLQFFSLRVPPGTTSLDDIPIRVKRSVAPRATRPEV